MRTVQARSPHPLLAAPRRGRAELAPLVLAFVLSGAAGLIYETIWSRYLGLLVGHSAYAQVVVLVLFMGGMAGGALAISRRSERLSNPLLLYALVEAAIGVLGIAFHPTYVALTGWAYQSAFPALGGTTGVAILKWGLAVPLILPPSLLLGATFPLMSAGIVRRSPRNPGRTLALLYFANSLGAAAGGLLAGFVLVEAAGLPGTVIAAGILNLLVALIVVVTIRGSRGRAVEGAAASLHAATQPPNPPRSRGSGRESGGTAAPAAAEELARLLLIVSFGTAVASFVYEIAWIRLLSLVLGSATHSFELMLSAFVFGLALGALWTRSRADRFRSPIRVLATAQWAMGALALATLPLYATSFHWMAGLVDRLQGAPHGYEIFSLARYGICLMVMIPATFCAGVTLPLITRVLMTSGSGERAIGAVYGLNTLGSIAGAVLAGLVLLPWLGVQRLLAAGALLDLLLGVVLLTRAENPSARRAALPALAGAFAVVLAAVLFVRLDPLLLASGVYRTGELLDPRETQVEFYRDGRTATVSVRRQTDGSKTLSTNGKPDASITSTWLAPTETRTQLLDDDSTQLLAALVSLAHAPRARAAAVIGQGSGMTSHVLLGSPWLRRLVTIEIEPEMIAGSRAFYPANRRVFDDPRSSFALDDARSYLAATHERFDLIVSEPSNPWVSGVSGLFTDEFYQHVHATLGERGVLGQWLHLYSLDDDLALRVLAAIDRNFASYRTYLVSSSDLLIVATNRPEGLASDWSIAQSPGFAGELDRTYPFSPRIFDALWVTDQSVLRPLLHRLAPNSDYFPALDLGAERTRFEGRVAKGLLQLHEDRFGISAVHSPAVDPPPDVPVPLPRVTRVRSLAWVARLRSALAGAPPRASDTADFADRLRQGVERQRAILASCASGAPPASWRDWLVEALRGENERHTGTTGWVDADYFRVLLRYATAQRAPALVPQTLEWLSALDGRDYPRAAQLSDSLVAAATGDSPWLAADFLLDGAVMAKLGAGDTEGARRAFLALTPRLRRAPTDLRTRLMAARLGVPLP